MTVSIVGIFGEQVRLGPDRTAIESADLRLS